MFYQEKLLFAGTTEHNYRIPSLVAAKDGTILAFCNDRKTTLIDHAENTALVCARKKAGQEWEEVYAITDIPGWTCMLGSALYDRDTDTVFCSAERVIPRDEFGTYTDEEIRALQEKMRAESERQGVLCGQILFKTRDGGDTWAEETMQIRQRDFVTADGKTMQIGGACHGSAHGIQLRHGAHKGRLLCPSRIFTGRYSTWDEAIRCCYNNSVFSDDHGRTWQASSPVQQGTGEGTLIERCDGSILYNSRGMFRNQKRYLAASYDGGETYGEFREDDFLYEEKSIGCNASFLQVEKEDLPELPQGVQAITLFANPRAEKRENMTVCVSFDEGATWPRTKTIWAGGSAYSSLDYDPVSRHFFLLYEKGETAENPYQYGLAVAEFDLQWLLQTEE